MADLKTDPHEPIDNHCTITKDSSVSFLKLSHKQKKALIKKEKRKLKRKALAKERDQQLEKEQNAQKISPGYIARLQQEEEEANAEILKIEAESKRHRELWEWSEDIYKEKLKQRKEQEEQERLNRLEIERKIKEEWEERQKKEKEEEEQKKKKAEKQDELLRTAREGENKDGDWHNPLAPAQYGRERVVDPCPFFGKVGACRFGDRCSRTHSYPESGRTILFTNLFRHFQLDQGLCEEYDTDIVLEYEDSDIYQKFFEFYEDTLPEFKAVGSVIQFKVCCNFQPHLRGNVYISYSREDDALKAYTKMNARWYGGKQLTAQFVEIPSWKRAICGLFGKGRCPKGRECNFLHVFKNPTNEFDLADRDMESYTPRHRNDRLDRRNDRHVYSTDRYRKRSRTPSRSHKKHRSRSSDRNKRSKRSHSRERKYNSKVYHKSKSSQARSASRGRERSRSRSKDRGYLPMERKSRSRDQEYLRSEAPRKSMSRSKERSKHFHTYRSRSRERINVSKCRSPNRTSHKHKKRKRSERHNSSSSDSSNSDLEEVWVERTTDAKKRNGT